MINESKPQLAYDNNKPTATYPPNNKQQWCMITIEKQATSNPSA